MMTKRHLRQMHDDFGDRHIAQAIGWGFSACMQTILGVDIGRSPKISLKADIRKNRRT